MSPAVDDNSYCFCSRASCRRAEPLRHRSHAVRPQAVLGQLLQNGGQVPARRPVDCGGLVDERIETRPLLSGQVGAGLATALQCTSGAPCIYRAQLAGPDSRPDSRGPGTVINTSLAAITRPAQIAPPRSCGGRVGLAGAFAWTATGAAVRTRQTYLAGRRISLTLNPSFPSTRTAPVFPPSKSPEARRRPVANS